VRDGSGSVRSADAALTALDQSIQTHGGNGLALEYGLADLWFVTRLMRTALVSWEMVLNFVASHSLGLSQSYVQLDEPRNDQPAAARVPGLDPRRRYQVTDVTPGVRRPRRHSAEEVPMTGLQVSGAALAEIGLGITPQRTLTALVILVEAP
jgi:hypothetical protein